MFQASESKATPRWARPRNFVFALALVLAVAAFGLLTLQRYSEAQYRRALQTDELGLAAYDLANAGMRIALTHPANGPGATQTEVNEAAEARILLARSLMRFREDARATDDGPMLDRVEAFAETMRQLQIAIQDQNYAAIPAIQASSSDQFNSLAQYIRESSVNSADRAREAQTFALAGRLIIFLSSATVIVVMYGRYRAVRRRAESEAAERELIRRSEAHFRPLVENSADTIMVVDADDVVRYASPAVERLVGMTPEEVTSKSVLDVVPSSARQSFSVFLAGNRRQRGMSATSELEFDAPAGHKQVELVCTNRLDDPDVCGLVLNIRDVTERRALEQQLRFQAFHDPLTGLANSSLFNDRLEHGLVRARRSGRGEISVIYLDLDHFKSVNDEFGHLAGDGLLREVACRLQACIRASDTAARLGGDEFAILIDDAAAGGKARDVADRIFRAMAQPFGVDSRHAQISASIGVIVADPETMSAGDVLRNADLAMYDAKHHGRNRVHHFKPTMLLALSDLDAEAATAAAGARRTAA